jgi:hypothetical protein
MVEKPGGPHSFQAGELQFNSFPDFFISFLAEPLSLLGGRGKKFTLYVAPV